MKKFVVAALVASFCMAPFSLSFAEPPAQVAAGEELNEHPRIATAVRDLEDAIAYMEAAPHNFGGHKAAAIAACHKAINQLRKAMAYRARKDGK
ncbi:MAG TPA: hypothetical protein VLX68_08285 [Chitinivibrionales bacterium]|nr:hypothetical protein [Chitinivibrionales bacterium]